MLRVIRCIDKSNDTEMFHSPTLRAPPTSTFPSPLFLSLPARAVSPGVTREAERAHVFALLLSLLPRPSRLDVHLFGPDLPAHL